MVYSSLNQMVGPDLILINLQNGYGQMNCDFILISHFWTLLTWNFVGISYLKFLSLDNSDLYIYIQLNKES